MKPTQTVRSRVAAALLVIVLMTAAASALILLSVLWDIITRPGDRDFQRFIVILIVLSVGVGVGIGMVLGVLIYRARLHRILDECVRRSRAAAFGAEMMGRRYGTLIERVAARTGFIPSSLDPEERTRQAADHLRSIGIEVR